MAKKYKSVEELYGSRKAGAAPLIWILTILLLLISIATLLVGTPIMQSALMQLSGGYPGSNGGNGDFYLPSVTTTPAPTLPSTEIPEIKETPAATDIPVTGGEEENEEEPETTGEPTSVPTPFLKPYISPAPTAEPVETTPAPTAFLQPAASPTPEEGEGAQMEAGATLEEGSVEGLSLTEAGDVAVIPEASVEPEVSVQPETSMEPEDSTEPEATAEPTEEPVEEPESTPAQDAQMRTFASIPDVVEAVNPAVVGVLNYQYVTGYTELMAVGSGSGFVVSEDGYVLTNAHVVSGAKRLEVLFEDGTSIVAELVGRDIPSDIALLKIEKEGLTVLPMGNSDYIRQGEYVLAIGNPLDSQQLYGTVTFGIISATAREINIDGYVNTYLQTDAAINLGNSGGPLVNLNGQVIGMNTAKSVVAGYDENGNAVAAEGIGFALPINMVIDIANQILIYGGVERPGVGLQVLDLEAASAQLQGLVPGVLVNGVTAGGPAEAAGLQAGDIIVKLNGEDLMGRDVLVSYCQGCSVGDSMTLTVYRGGQYLEIVLTVGNINDFSE